LACWFFGVAGHGMETRTKGVLAVLTTPSKKRGVNMTTKNIRKTLNEHNYR
jgi:hypothetical protein